MPYLLDANVFIQAKNLHYGMDFCPGFWDWLLEANADGRVFSVESVGDELQGVEDELSARPRNRGSAFCLRNVGPFCSRPRLTLLHLLGWHAA